MNSNIIVSVLKTLIEETVKAIFSGIEHYINNVSPAAKVSQVAVAAIVYFLYSVLLDPTGAINSFMIMIVDHVYDFFPATPEQYTIGFMLTEFAADYPYIGWGVVYEIFIGMAGMFSLWCVIKVWKLLPFT